MKNDLLEQTLAATDWEKPDPAWRELVVGRAVPKPRRRPGKTVWAVAACWMAILGLKVATPKEVFVYEGNSSSERNSEKEWWRHQRMMVADVNWERSDQEQFYGRRRSRY
ncbi:hypothetical protein OAF27_03345 [Verrucomicrobiales bacterium]|nr:hypothetical protein [Verrucomicrobiales bacterium]